MKKKNPKLSQFVHQQKWQWFFIDFLHNPETLKDRHTKWHPVKERKKVG